MGQNGEAPADTELTQSRRKNPRRRYGTGSIRIKHGAWYGSWRSGNGKRTTRKIGPLDKLTEEEAEERLQAMINGAVYRRRAQQPRCNEHAGVYFIAGADKVKIGRTERTPVAVRLERLQRCSPVPLTLLRFVACGFPDTVEQALHAHFADQRCYVEWFDRSVLEAIDGWSDEEIVAMGRRATARDTP